MKTVKIGSWKIKVASGGNALFVNSKYHHSTVYLDNSMPNLIVEGWNRFSPPNKAGKFVKAKKEGFVVQVWEPRRMR